MNGVDAGTDAPAILRRRRVILAEGPTDRPFLAAVAADLGLPLRSEDVHDVGGEGNLDGRIRLLAKDFIGEQRATLSLAVFRDADDDPDAAFASVAKALNKAGLPVPAAPGEFNPGPPNVGVFICPGPADQGTPQRTGEIETLMLQAVRDKARRACAESYIECVVACADERNPVKKPSKLAMEAFCAALVPRERGLRELLPRIPEFWDLADPALTPLRRFLEQL